MIMFFWISISDTLFSDLFSSASPFSSSTFNDYAQLHKCVKFKCGSELKVKMFFQLHTLQSAVFFAPLNSRYVAASAYPAAAVAAILCVTNKYAGEQRILFSNRYKKPKCWCENEMISELLFSHN